MSKHKAAHDQTPRNKADSVQKGIKKDSASLDRRIFYGLDREGER